MEGRVIQGNHEPLISKEVFIQVNELKRENLVRLNDFEHVDNIPLKQFLKCDGCGTYLRGYLVKQKGIYYYKCDTIGCGTNKNAKQLNQHFIDILGEISLKEEYQELFRMQLKALYNGINEERETISTEVKQKTRELDEKLGLETSSSSSFSFRNLPLIFLYKSFFSFSTANLENYINYSFQIVSKLPSIWTSSNYAEKREFQKMLFPEGIFYNKKNGQTRTEKLNPLFCLIAGQQRVSAERKRDLSFEFQLKSLLVVLTGIEPVSKV